MATWKAENSMLTQVGVEILNKIKAGVGSITVTRVVAGSGRVPASQLFQQTALSGDTKPMVITQKDVRDTGSEISIYITNEDYTEPFNLNQIGVYVSHPDYLEEQLYHISQCEEVGFDVIPALDETPVTFGYSLFLEHGNSDSINLTVDPQGMVTLKDFEKFKSTRVSPNLLDNWYFANPVNSLSEHTYMVDTSSQVSVIDRWKLERSMLLLHEDGMFFSNSHTPGASQLIQELPLELNLAGRQVTMSLMTSSGLYYKTFVIPESGERVSEPVTVDGTDIVFTVDTHPNAYKVLLRKDNATFTLSLVAIKLEFGSEQTLAHQDSNGKWVLNEIPNFAEEAAKCAQYDPNTGAYIGTNYFSNDVVIQKANNGKSILFKNHSADDDYGTELKDVDNNGNSASLSISASQDPSFGNILMLKYNGISYTLYGEHNRHLLDTSEVITATLVE